MTQEQIIASIPAYLDGTLNENEVKAFELGLKDCATCRDELEGYQKLYSAFEQEQPILPTKNLKGNFFQLIEEEKQNTVKVVSINPPENSSTKSWFSSLLKVAASIAILIAAFSTGRYFQSEKSEAVIVQIKNENLQTKQTAMLSLMQNQSASKRIQGVQYIQEFENPDTAIINALADRMLHDKNTNVRLTAVEALSNFSNSEMVKTAFITALETEKNPSVQIAIIQNLVKTQERKAIEPMKKLLQEEDTQPFVKEEINQVLSEII